jgi:hypothetical protein
MPRGWVASGGLRPVALRGQATGGLGRASEPRECPRVMPWRLDLVELVIRHPGFSVWLWDGQRTTGTAPGAAEGFRAVVGVANLGQVQASIARADITAHEQRHVGLPQRTEAVVGIAMERAGHAATQRPAGWFQRLAGGVIGCGAELFKLGQDSVARSRRADGEQA